jgi:uncharacterized RDD family membrane protein YckC
MSSGYERATLFLEGIGRNRRELVTPEGVTLPIDVAEIGDRAAAFALDLFIWLCATAVIYVLFGSLAYGGFRLIGETGGLVGVTIMLFIAFLVRNLYFIHFELVWQGATPGKRIVGLRVIDRRGGPLLPGAIVARNLTREIETFLPLGLLLSLAGGASTSEKFVIAVWLLLFAGLPFFNRDRLRGGDLIAGTMVIALPRRRLLGDLVEAGAQFRFTEAQLGAYGAFELQILEEVLRRPDGPETSRIAREICDKICRKVHFAAAVPPQQTLLFLREFYTAQRAFLERQQLFGRPRPDKHHARAER